MTTVCTAPSRQVPTESYAELLSPTGTIALSGIQPHGIGQAIARELCAQDLRVICCDRDDQRGRAAVAELHSEAIHFVAADLATAAGVDTFLDAVARVPGPLRGLVCNAGSAGDPREDDILHMSPEHFHQLLDNNLTNAWLLTRGVLQRFFLAHSWRGSVVFLGSNNGQHGYGILGQPGYGIAKTGLSALLAHLVARFGRLVNFNLVRPGVVLTQSENWQRRLRLLPTWPQLEGQCTPAGRLADPSDVAHLVAFLLSEKARHINGAEIPIDGGMTCAGPQFPGIDPTRFRESYVAAVATWHDHNGREEKNVHARPKPDWPQAIAPGRGLDAGTDALRQG